MTDEALGSTLISMPETREERRSGGERRAYPDDPLDPSAPSGLAQREVAELLVTLINQGQSVYIEDPAHRDTFIDVSGLELKRVLGWTERWAETY